MKKLMLRHIGKYCLLLLFGLFLTACGGNNTETRTEYRDRVVPEVRIEYRDRPVLHNVFSVSNLRAFPTGPTSVRLEWLNPNASDIRGFNIIYNSTGAPDVGNGSFMPAEHSVARLADTYAAYELTGLRVANGNYTLGVLVVFEAASNKSGRVARVAHSVGGLRPIVLLGDNLDDDEYADADPLETDTDGDGIDDFNSDGTLRDNCPRFIGSNDQTDTDGDGQGNPCDADDDNDGRFDADDTTCLRGVIGWDSTNISLDHDQDGCRDSDEDTDDDNDGKSDSEDLICPGGMIGWDSTNISLDHDQDGCRDSDEDDDDDNDGVLDAAPDDCPTGDIGWSPNRDTDNDGDGCRDATEDTDDDNDGTSDTADVDDDGDGLIEIHNATELHAMRYNLRGTGLDLTDRAGDNTTGGDSTGCGGGMNADGDNIADCFGYELAADIDLADPIYGGDYDNWQPVGSSMPMNQCWYEGHSGNAFTMFNATFDGNGHTISNLVINSTTVVASANLQVHGVGLFGAATHFSELRNLTLQNVRITASDYNDIMCSVGSLLGQGGYSAANDGVTIHNVVVNASVIDGVLYVGGLVGDALYANISSNYIKVSTLEVYHPIEFTGGLMGRGDYSSISYNYVEIDNIYGGRGYVGGLVGSGQNSTISSNYVLVGNITGSYVSFGLGGLVGSGQSSTISSSYAVVDHIVGGRMLGGLIGDGTGSHVDSSYALTIRLFGTIGRSVDGLVGHNSTEAVVNDSYWLNNVTFTHSPENSSRIPSGAGQAKGLIELRSPTNTTAGDAGSVYENWVDDLCADGTPAWDFGTRTEFPALTCFGLDGIAAQRQAHREFLRRHPIHSPE